MSSLPKLMAEMQQLERDRISLQHKSEGLLADLVRHKNTLQEKDKTLQQAEEGI